MRLKLEIIQTTTKMSFTERLDQLIDKKERVERELSEELMTVIRETLKEFFKDSKITKITWTQYTDYFNDGEPCTFCIYEPEFFTNDETDLWIIDKRGYGYSIGEARGNLPEEKWDLFLDLWKSCCRVSDMMQSLLGDHVKIVCTPDKIEIEEYTNHN